MPGRIIKNPAALASSDLGAPAQVPLPIGDTISAVRTKSITDAKQEEVASGIWECTPGVWRRTIVGAEFAHFLQGRCTFEGDDGQVLHFAAGDSVLFEPNSLGKWTIHETTRKVFVVF